LSIRSSRAFAVALVTFATFVDLVAYSALVPVLPDLGHRLGATPTVIGLLFGSFGITLLAVSVPMGALSDAIGRRVPLIGGLVGLASATALFAVSHTLPWLFAARLLQGAADGVTWVAGFALIADLYASHERGRVMGYVMSATSFGVMIGPALGGYLYEMGGMAGTFASVAALALLGAAGFALLTPTPREARGEAPSIWSVVSHPGVALCAALVVVAAGTLAMFEPVLPLFFSNTLHLSPTQIGLVFAAGAVASVVMPMVYGPWTTRWGGRRLTMIGLALTAAWMTTLPLATGLRSALVLVVIQWMAIALIATPSLAYMAEVTSFAGADSYGVGYGVYNAAWALGLLAGPSLGGFLYERLGFTHLTWAWAPSVVVLAWMLSRWEHHRPPAIDVV
jgi:DHA1 family solute carrier family 18 vesicular amine transporter 1/2